MKIISELRSVKESFNKKNILINNYSGLIITDDKNVYIYVVSNN